MTSSVSTFSLVLDRMIKRGKFDFILRLARGCGPDLHIPLWSPIGYVPIRHFDNQYSDMCKPAPEPIGWFSYRASVLGRVFEPEQAGVLNRRASELCRVV
jgi:hypothetical protein